MYYVVICGGAGKGGTVDAELAAGALELPEGGGGAEGALNLAPRVVD